MSNVLTKIVDHKKQELALRKEKISLKQIELDLQASKKSLFEALSKPKSSFIFECKKASPSKGLIRKNFDLKEILASYSKHASAISVLTDNKYFQGSFEYLQLATSTMLQPVLCKDFFIDPYQVAEARYYGADAILLMLSVLNDEQYKTLASKANELNLDILTEVHDHEELRRAIDLDAKIIGVNNRNLKDLTIDLNTTSQLIASLSDEEKNNRVFISESGINNNQQVREISDYVDGFLVGSSIMQKENIDQQCKSLIYGNTKICGLTSNETARSAFEAGAIYGGLIFHEKSPRYVNLKKAKEVVRNVELNFVGVFVNSPIDKLLEIAETLDLKFIQLHGNEDNQYIQQVKSALPDCEIWKAQAIDTQIKDLEKVELNHSNADYVLLDAKYKEQLGGTGKTFEWQLVKSMDTSKIILAGGLNKENIKQARALNTHLLDVNSGVESSPGVKDTNKIKELFNYLHA